MSQGPTSGAYKLKGLVHSVESMGSLDGPGLRTVFFMQGCNMRCCYCHNPDSWSPSGGAEYSAEDILSAALDYKPYYGDSGGVTFSGGEPLLQADFLIEAVELLKAHGIASAVDTSGSVFNKKTRTLFNAAALVILDIKHAKKERYLEICSFPGDATFENLQYLQKNKIRYWIRQVVAAGLTDDDRQIDELAALLQEGARPEKTELLAYHSMGAEKWSEVEDAYTRSVSLTEILRSLTPPEPARLKFLQSRLDDLLK